MKKKKKNFHDLTLTKAQFKIKKERKKEVTTNPKISLLNIENIENMSKKFINRIKNKNKNFRTKTKEIMIQNQKGKK